MSVIDLPRQFFMVRFGEEEEYLAALTGGPWRAFGTYLMVREWSPEFEPMKDEIVTTPVWVRVANIPVNFYHRSILMGIAKGLGKPLRVDTTSLNFERARFARVCVEVNLKKPLKGSVIINGTWFFVEYEGLTNICAKCGLYGHLAHTCGRGMVAREAGGASLREGESPRENVNADDGFTPVRGSGRPTRPEARNVVFAAGGSGGELGKNRYQTPRSREVENIPLANSFGRLVADLNPSEIGNVVLASQANNGKKGLGRQPQNHPNRIHGTVESFAKGVGKENVGPRGNGGRHVGANGPRAKLKQVRPTRGLVFGNSNEAVELSLSGKRLRVEESSTCRPGGVVIMNTETGSSLVEMDSESRGKAELSRLEKTRDRLEQMTTVRPTDPSEKEMELSDV